MHWLSGLARVWSMWLFGGSTPANADLAEKTKPAVTLPCLLTLAQTAGAAFVESLKDFAEQEQTRWVEERRKLEELRVRLQRKADKLTEDCQRFEEERLRYGPGSACDDDVVALNVGGEARVSVTRSTLTQCQGSMLAAAFSGRWDLRKDDNGEIFIDCSPKLFLPLVEHLRQRAKEKPDKPPALPPPCFEDPVADEQFVDMLRYYGVLDWVYRQRPVEIQVEKGDYCYSVLPPVPQDTNKALIEMRGMHVVIPRGWYVLGVADANFDEALKELTRHPFGCGVFVMHDKPGGESNYTSSSSRYCGYRTCLSTSGDAGSKFETPPRWFEWVSGDGREMRFAGSSYRLVICRRVGAGSWPARRFAIAEPRAPPPPSAPPLAPALAPADEEVLAKEASGFVAGRPGRMATTEFYIGGSDVETSPTCEEAADEAIPIELPVAELVAAKPPATEPRPARCGKTRPEEQEGGRPKVAAEPPAAEPRPSRGGKTPTEAKSRRDKKTVALGASAAAAVAPPASVAASGAKQRDAEVPKEDAAAVEAMPEVAAFDEARADSASESAVIGTMEARAAAERDARAKTEATSRTSAEAAIKICAEVEAKAKQEEHSNSIAPAKVRSEAIVEDRAKAEAVASFSAKADSNAGATMKARDVADRTARADALEDTTTRIVEEVRAAVAAASMAEAPKVDALSAVKTLGSGVLELEGGWKATNAAAPISPRSEAPEANAKPRKTPEEERDEAMLHNLVRDAHPAWTATKVIHALTKLTRVGITSPVTLAGVVSVDGELNRRLAEAGLRSFRDESLAALKMRACGE